jgi:hypothetical protein
VFVDGDFWHGRLLSERGKKALRQSFKTNHSFWVKKITRNVERDLAQNALLRRSGWSVLRLWEKEILQDLSHVVHIIDRRMKGVKVTRTPGICHLLGLQPFTPHDLRRTAATMCGELGLSEAGISLCLDHQANKDENGKRLPAITRKVYNLATRARVAKKREVLDAWAVELRRIVGEPMEARKEMLRAA